MIVRPLISFVAVMAVATLPAVAQITQPQLGYMRDSSGALRPIFGIAAAATLGDPALDNVISFACSAKLCLAKTDAALVSVGSNGVEESIPAPAGPAIIAHAKQGAWIYFSSTQQLTRWKEGALTAVDFSPDGRVLSLRATADGLDYAVARDGSGRVSMEHFSPGEGSMVLLDSFATDSIDAADEAKDVMLLDGGVLSASPDQVTLKRADGTALTFPVTGARAFHAAGKGYVEISASSGLWILRTDPGQEQLSMLPGGQH